LLAFHLSNMTMVYFPFKMGNFSVSIASSLGIAASHRTLVHSEIMFRVPCREQACRWCPESRKQGQRSSWHFVAYLVSLDRPWRRDVDHRRYERDARSFTYVAAPFPNARKAMQTMDEQIGKPINYSGFMLNFLLPVHFGVTDALSPLAFQMPSYMCAELISCILAQQGFAAYLNHPPCKMYPYDLWQTTRHLPGALLLQAHPSERAAAQRIVKGTRVDSPPGLFR
jgi:hypothetical protein